MSEQLAPCEREQFFRRLGWNGEEPFEERRSTGLTPGWLTLGKRKPRTAAELDAYFAELRARIDELEAGATV